MSGLPPCGLTAPFCGRQLADDREPHVPLLPFRPLSLHTAPANAPTRPPTPQEKADSSSLLACLRLIRVFAPGSESHTSVALKCEGLASTRAELAEYLAVKEVCGRGWKKGGKGEGGPGLAV